MTEALDEQALERFMPYAGSTKTAEKRSAEITKSGRFSVIDAPSGTPATSTELVQSVIDCDGIL